LGSLTTGNDQQGYGKKTEITDSFQQDYFFGLENGKIIRIRRYFALQFQKVTLKDGQNYGR
jgi:hypothetical protein